MKAYLWLLILAVYTLLPSAAKGQEVATRAAGIGVTDETMFDILMVTTPGFGSNARQSLEQQSVLPYLMPTRSMSARGADWSYALAGCLEFYINLNRNYKDNVSPDYLSLSLQSLGRRPSMEEGLRFLVTNGAYSAALVPYDATTIPPAIYGAQPYRISNFLHLFRDFTKGRQKTFEVRKALMRGNPVLVEIMADPNFRQQFGQYLWTPTGQPTQINALTVVGYDETLQAFQLRSYWGNEWGVNGYIWIKYEDFERFAQNGFVMIPLSQ